MGSHLVVTVHLHDGRFHGLPEWPPSPARLFQALVAGAACGADLPAKAVAALEWLESLPPPTIWVPHVVMGSQVDLFVPNNDLDSEDGDPKRVEKIRTKKLLRPRLLGSEAAFLYAFELPPDTTPANDVLILSDYLYQFGRGIDQAWAVGNITSELDSLLRNRDGQLYRPAKEGPSEITLSCPTRGTLQSLTERFAANRQRLQLEGTGKSAKMLFVQPPKARFAQVTYEAPPRQVLFELRQGNDETRLFPWPLRGATKLIESLRDMAHARLLNAMPESGSVLDRYLIGRKPDGDDPARTTDRIRLIPLPSRGHEHVDPAIRRVLLEVPGNCPLRFDDVSWALSGQPYVDDTTGEVLFLLVNTTDDKPLRYYVPPRGARKWRSISGVALPATRRRIDPTRQREDAKPARERVSEEVQALNSVRTAVRHAGLDAQVTQIRVQREPLDRRGEHAEKFAEGTRFSRHQMWHVEVDFDRPVRGPLVLGDGRFLGLGVMAPASRDNEGVWAFQAVEGLFPNADAEEIASALRRAVMARAQAALGPRAELPSLISGHTPDGSALRDKGHLAFQFDPSSRMLLVLAPHVIERRSAYPSERDDLKVLDRALEDFSELRAGRSGLLRLARVSIEEQDCSLFASSRTWTSSTPYLVTRHAKSKDAKQALAADVHEECVRRGLPIPKSIEVLGVRGIAGKGLTGEVRIEFATAITGPVLLGKSRFCGGGSFVGEGE